MKGEKLKIAGITKLVMSIIVKRRENEQELRESTKNVNLFGWVLLCLCFLFP